MAKRGGEDKRPKNFSSANGTAGDWLDNFCHNVEDWVDALWRRTGACNYLRWLSTPRSIRAGAREGKLFFERLAPASQFTLGDNVTIIGILR